MSGATPGADAWRAGVAGPARRCRSRTTCVAAAGGDLDNGADPGRVDAYAHRCAPRGLRPSGIGIAPCPRGGRSKCLTAATIWCPDTSPRTPALRGAPHAAHRSDAAGAPAASRFAAADHQRRAAHKVMPTSCGSGGSHTYYGAVRVQDGSAAGSVKLPRVNRNEKLAERRIAVSAAPFTVVASDFPRSHYGAPYRQASRMARASLRMGAGAFSTKRALRLAQSTDLICSTMT